MQKPNTSQLLASLHEKPNIWTFTHLPNHPSAITINFPPSLSSSDIDIDNLEAVTIVFSSKTFAQSLNDHINANLTEALNRAIYDNGLLSEARTTTLFSRTGNGIIDIERHPVSGLSIPVDALEGDVVDGTLLLPNLAELVLQAPHVSVTSPGDSTTTNSIITNTNDTMVIHFLSSLRASLNLVILTLTPMTAILPILTAMRVYHPNLTRLGLRLSSLSTSSSDLSQADKTRISNDVLQGLKGFDQLEHIMIENTLFDGNQALNMELGALPYLSHVDIQTSEFMTNEEDISQHLRETLPHV